MIFVKLRCKCGFWSKEARIKKPTPCPKCGGERRYSKKWFVFANVYDPDTGRMKRVVRAVSPDKSDAILELERITRIGIGAEAPKNMADLMAAFQDWASDQYTLNLLAGTTIRHYQERVKHLTSQWGQMQVAQFCHGARERVEKYMCERIAHVAPATVNREVAVLKRVMNWAVTQKIIPESPLAGVKFLPENNTRERVLSEEEEARLMDVCSGKLRTIVIIALNTGLRISSILSLHCDDIDFGKNEIVKTVKHHRRLGERKVRIPMTAAVRDALNDHGVSSGYLFPSRSGCSEHILPTSDFGFQRALKKAGIEDFTFHDLRHTFATRFLQRTRNLFALGKILGHSPMEAYRTSLRYAHVMDKDKADAMGIFEKGAAGENGWVQDEKMDISQERSAYGD